MAVVLKANLHLYLAPQQLRSDGRCLEDTDRLLFEFPHTGEIRGREVEYLLTLRATRPLKKEEAESSSGTPESMLLGSLTSMEASLFDSSCSVRAVLRDVRMELTSSTYDRLYEIENLPTRHIFLRKGEIAKPLMQRLVERHVVTLGLPYADAVHHLPALLFGLNPSAPLRHVVIFESSCSLFRNSWHSGLDRLLKDALQWSSLVDGVFFSGLPAPMDVARPLELCSSMYYVGFDDSCSRWDLTEEWLTRLELPDCRQLKELVVRTRVNDPFRFNDWTEAGLSSLTRLDLDIPRRGSTRFPLPLPSHVIDFGTSISSVETVERLFASEVHSRVLILRLRLDSLKEIDAAWKMLIMDESSTVQYFDCILEESRTSYLKGLAGTRPPPALTALRIRRGRDCGIYGDSASDTMSHLASFLCSPAARNLVYLDCDTFGTHHSEERTKDDWECANSLTINFTICTFRYPFTNTAAESYAISLLRRNRLYRDSHLSHEPYVKPNVAKLFLCGHAEVGKTTLRMALQSIQNPSVSSFVKQRFLKPKVDRTRGMVMEPLSYKLQNKKLLICDLAGQEEFHVYHHYFMNASINDIFIVVCKHDKSCLTFKDFNLQLEYWLRFIVSHRSTRQSLMDSVTIQANVKPKVIVVVNFFQQIGNADATAYLYTSSLMQKFSEALDFTIADEARQPNEFKNLFALNAMTRFGVQKLNERLDSLLRDFGDAAFPVPKLCYDIAEHLAKGRGKSTRLTGIAKPKLLTCYSEILKWVFEQSSDVWPQVEARVQAALQELHTQGFIIYFPLEGADRSHGASEKLKKELGGEDSTNNALVIIDTNWFSNKLVGSLLGTNLPKASENSSGWLWSIEEIKIILHEQGCNEHQSEEILRYLQHLELCISVDGCPGFEGGQLLFPALAKKNVIVFPKTSNATSTKFFGRRLKCRDPSIHLIPFAIFTRLQVKLLRHYSGGNHSFQLGYGWVSFMKGMVGVVVRFGGDTIHDRWEHKQWIDILIFCPESSSGGYQTGPMTDPRFIQAQVVVNEIRDHFYATCKAEGLGGIPTVMLEELVLENKEAMSDSTPLASILRKVTTEGLLESHQEWSTMQSTHVLELLLPEEIERCVKGRLDVLASIHQEFSLGDQGDGESNENVQPEQDGEKNQSSDGKTEIQLTGEFQELKCVFTAHFQDLMSEMKSHRTILAKIDTTLDKVREDIRTLKDVLRQVEQEIIANCSTRLLRHELRKDRAYPLYPYLVDVEGKLAPLWEAMFGKQKVRVHFLCEYPKGPHPVEGQKGKEVNINWKPWVRAAARVMVPAVKVICCLARVAASVYLPSAHVFIPTPEVLVSGLGIGPEELQHVILPRALEALLKNVGDVDVKEWIRCTRTPEKQEMQEVIAAILENREMDMEAEFGMKRVIFTDYEHPFWVCDRHAGKQAEIGQIKNPYAH